ncbi:3-oxoacyl-ACP synthase [Spirosoma validum]|uniref:3-oxoacyl-ACP synthase n=1 Tax=Spirosoma validum TaxID=2771355 RepID=A0A927B1F6_9BACT|nr:3-oxoacyl-ACP synthase [Spirosoma validum]MBD2753658.1 3-oxoacyl-ACP synthase [Spirosoma validum]
MTSTDQQTKAALFERCQTYVQQRIDTARQAMEAAQEAANSESKSSAGDKYETGRAMAQLERDRNAQLLAEALKLSQDLGRLNIDKSYDTVQPGSLVTTNRGSFFISISAGKLTVNGTDYFAISPASPIATALSGRKTGEVATFNKLAYQLVEII